MCIRDSYNEETLQVTYKDKTIYDVLEMTIEDSLTFFDNLPRIRSKPVSYTHLKRRVGFT